MRHADDFNGGGFAGEVFQWHCDEEKQEVGGAFDKAGPAEVTDGGEDGEIHSQLFVHKDMY